ncbi:virulence RhuM family protein [Mariprofundus ferrooxydans]|nr:virulence RhuM family protein [Mariprofundus ferrooxydans]
MEKEETETMKDAEQSGANNNIGISDFSTKPTNYYNLDIIISVGCRVKSKQGTQFRIWATQRLKEYIIKGFALNDVVTVPGLESCIRRL